MDWDQDDNTTKLTSKKEYDCVICNQTTPSSEDVPMGLVVLVQVMNERILMGEPDSYYNSNIIPCYSSPSRQQVLLATSDSSQRDWFYPRPTKILLY